MVYFFRRALNRWISQAVTVIDPVHQRSAPSCAAADVGCLYAEADRTVDDDDAAVACVAASKPSSETTSTATSDRIDSVLWSVGHHPARERHTGLQTLHI